MGKKSGSRPVIPGWSVDREVQGSRCWETSLELGVLPWAWDSASMPRQLSCHPSPPSLPLRVVSTGASRMVSWTPITPATSLKASVAFQTTWTQPWPSLLIATVAGSGSTFSRVLGQWGRGGGGAGGRAVFFHTSLGTGLRLCPPHCQELLTSIASGLPSLAHAHPFSGKQYWEYHFQQQPSQEECEGSSLSTVFEHFALMQQHTWEDIFRLLFRDTSSGMEGGQVLLPPQEGWDPLGR